MKHLMTISSLLISAFLITTRQSYGQGEGAAIEVVGRAAIAIIGHHFSDSGGTFKLDLTWIPVSEPVVPFDPKNPNVNALELGAAVHTNDFNYPHFAVHSKFGASDGIEKKFVKAFSISGEDDEETRCIGGSNLFAHSRSEGQF